MNFYSKIMLINKVFEVSPSDPGVLHQSLFAVLPSSQTSVPAQRVASTIPDSVSKNEPLCFQKAYAFYLKECSFSRLRILLLDLIVSSQRTTIWHLPEERPKD